jgi:hypothetical protein
VTHCSQKLSRPQRESKKVRRFKFFAFFCLVLKFIVLVGALCSIYELNARNRSEDVGVALFGVSHYVSMSHP